MDRFARMGLGLDGLTSADPLIYEWGHVSLRVKTPDGKIAEVKGKYLTVWKENSKGQWQITRNLSM